MKKGDRENMFLMHVFNKMRRFSDDKHALLSKLFKPTRKWYISSLLLIYILNCTFHT